MPRLPDVRDVVRQGTRHHLAWLVQAAEYAARGRTCRADRGPATKSLATAEGSANSQGHPCVTAEPGAVANSPLLRGDALGDRRVRPLGITARPACSAATAKDEASVILPVPPFCAIRAIVFI
jgi:hypothetical protein